MRAIARVAGSYGSISLTLSTPWKLEPRLDGAEVSGRVTRSNIPTP